ncbi:MAG TPA: hypothetical protein VN695_04700 [Streptosporangiaceae bacterium]|nr:hypothetical protein [Streptosporangiaceae bacterium]
MSDTPADQRWRVLFTPRWLSWHLFAVVAFAGMLWLGDWQFRRAVGGNPLSWAYTFEWPVFAVFGAVFWVKTIRDELRPSTPAQRENVVLPSGAGAGGEGTASQGTGAAINVARTGLDSRADDGENDTELAEYNAYLAVLNKEVKGHGKWHGLR